MIVISYRDVDRVGICINVLGIVYLLEYSFTFCYSTHSDGDIDIVSLFKAVSASSVKLSMML